MKKTKQFDCVEMKRRGAENIYKATKSLTEVEEVSYWAQRMKRLRQHQQMLHNVELVDISEA